MLLLLLDADVIIDLHKLGLWKQITKSHKVSIPSIVLHKEVYYYEDENGHHHIDLEREAGVTFSDLSCSAQELLGFKERFDRVFQEELHDGEKEALVLLQKQEDLLLCTCDHAAIKALALLDLSAQGISFEGLLKKSGMNKKLEYKHTEKRFKNILSEGNIMRIHGREVKKKR